MTRYVSGDEDSARWEGFPWRAGDVVISTRSKHGTTWMQMICALLILRTPDLPAPLSQLSPWLDRSAEPLDDVLRRLEAQPHRRFVKTHTPLDGVPLDPRARYVVVARAPLDAAVSLYHQGRNLRRENGPLQRPPLRDWLLGWIEADDDPRLELDSLPGVMHHLTGAWQRSADPAVTLVRYEDLIADLPGEMSRLATRLELSQPDGSLVAAAGLDAMRRRPERAVPNPDAFLDPAAFFRRGRPGAAAAVLTEAEQARYQTRAAELAPPDLLAWLGSSQRV